MRASSLALRYAADVMAATAAVIKVVEGNTASLAVVRHLGAATVGTARSDAGGTFLVHRLELTATKT